MWTKNKMSPAKYISLFMLAVYLCVGMLLLTKLRNLDVSHIVKTFIGAEEKSQVVETTGTEKPDKSKIAAKKLASRYVENLMREMESEPEPKRIAKSAESIARESNNGILTELMKRDGRLCMAPPIEPYFVRK
jgi:hypothetical protein